MGDHRYYMSTVDSLYIHTSSKMFRTKSIHTDQMTRGTSDTERRSRVTERSAESGGV